MPSGDPEQPQSGSTDDYPEIHCDGCQSALHADSQQSVSFLLLDHLTIPTISCDDHLEQFTSICGLTSEDTAELLDHRPAGGISCPSCHLARYNSARPMIPIQDGGIVVMACPRHQSEIVQRFHTGLQTRQQLTASLDTNPNSSL